MPEDTPVCVFVHHARTRWNPSVPLIDGAQDEISVTVHDAADAIEGEFAIRWYDLNGVWVPRLEVFDDCWRALARLPELIALLGDLNNASVSPLALCDHLTAIGFQDITANYAPESEAAR